MLQVPQEVLHKVTHLVAVDFPQEAEEEAPLVEADLPEVEEVDNTFFTENARNCIFFIYFLMARCKMKLQ